MAEKDAPEKAPAAPVGITADMLVDAYQKIQHQAKYGDTSPLVLVDEVVPIGEGNLFKIEKVDRTIPPTDRILG